MAENKRKKQIAFYATESERWQLKKEALRRETSVQAMLEQAVALYLSQLENFPGNSGAGGVPIGTVKERQPFAPGSEVLHIMLDFIWESGPEKSKSALYAGLDAMAAATQLYLEHETTRRASEEDDTEHLIRESREVTASAERALRDAGEAGTEDTPVTGFSWRKRA